MRTRPQPFTLLWLLLPSCSLLFDASAPEGTDGSPDPIDASGDASGVFCEDSIVLEPSGGLLNITRGQILDVDRDGLDDVLLVTESAGRNPEVFVHYGKCPLTSTWTYQQRWELQGPTAPMMPRVFAVAEGRAEKHRLIAMGEEGSTPSLMSYPLTDGVPAQEPDFAAPIPSHLSNMQCRTPAPPYFLLSGNFDNDSDPTPNDLALFSRQGWIYDVEQWNNPPAWDFVCEGNMESGSTPEQFAGPGERYGFMPVENLGTPTDEFVDARDNRLFWYSEDDRHAARNWPSDVDGVALSRVAISDDQKRDVVGWQQQLDTLVLHFAELFTDTGQGNFTMSTFSISHGPTAPTAGAVIAPGEDRGLVLLTDSTLRLFDINSGAPTALGTEVIFPFQPRFLLMPNWDRGEDVALVFDSDTAEFECLEINADGEFVGCERGP